MDDDPILEYSSRLADTLMDIRGEDVAPENFNGIRRAIIIILRKTFNHSDVTGNATMIGLFMTIIWRLLDPPGHDARAIDGNAHAAMIRAFQDAHAEFLRDMSTRRAVLRSIPNVRNIAYKCPIMQAEHRRETTGKTA